MYLELLIFRFAYLVSAAAVYRERTKVVPLSARTLYERSGTTFASCT